MKRGQKLARQKFSYRRTSLPPRTTTAPNFINRRDSHKEEILRDAGVGGVVSTYELFYGNPSSISFVNEKIEPFLLANSFRYLCGCGVHVAMNGLKYCKEDQSQAELYNAAEMLAQKLVQPRPQQLLQQREYLTFYSPETIVGLLPILLRNGIDLDQPLPQANLDLTTLATLMLKVNDYKYPAVHSEKPGSDEFRLDMIRQFLIQAPFAGIQRTFMKRMVRFYEINEHVLKHSSDEFVKAMDSYLCKHTGVGFSDLLALIIPLNASWITAKTAGPIYFEKTLESSKIWDKIQLFIKATGLSSEDFKQEMEALYKKHNEKFFGISASMAKLVQHPFLIINDDKALLLAPFLLLRSIELAIVSAFLEFRPKDTTKMQDLYGPLGKSFEYYCSELIRRHLGTSKKIVFEGNPTNPKTGNELCDAILEFDKTTIILEFKYRLPPLRALEALDESLGEIKSWIQDTYLLNAEEAKKRGKTRGALKQLDESASHILSGARGTRPELLVPIVVISEELISFSQLYSYLDKQLENEQPQTEITPFLLMSVGDLELLTSVNFSVSRWNLVSVIVEKATKKEARYMQWAQYLKRLGLSFNADKTRESKYDELFQLSKKHFD